MGSRLGAMKVAARRIGVPVEEYRDQVVAGFKWCYRCRNWVLRERFACDRSRSDGLKAVCLTCDHVKKRKGRLPTATPAQMQGAHDAVRYAIKRGRLARPTSLPCLDCGSLAAQYHHHRGYERDHWLDVVAVCISCHRKRHWIESEEVEQVG